jgi:hypothetical protein
MLENIVLAQLGKNFDFDIVPCVKHGFQAIAVGQLDHNALFHRFSLLLSSVASAAVYLTRFAAIAQGADWS